MSADRKQPVEISLKSDGGYGYKNFLDFLNAARAQGLLDQRNSESLILAADDQFVNRQLIELMASDLGLRERTRVFENGQQVIEFLDR